MDYIDFIHKNATPKVIKRGMEIFNSHKPHLYYDDDKTACFHVMGNNIYTIKIDFSKANKSELVTDCTCPYNDTFPGLCKHVVAAIYYMAINPKKFGKSKKDKRNTFKYFAYTEVDKFDF